MNFEEYVKEEFKKIDDKLDNTSQKIEALMIFMAVQKSQDLRQSKITAGVVSVICSVVSSGIMYFVTKG